jgi:hypothetical protein
LQLRLPQSNYTAFQKNKKRQSKPKVFSTKILDPSLKGCSEIFFPNYIHNKRKDQVSQTEIDEVAEKSPQQQLKVT